ncbi:spermatogenesis-associated serine-rich protein 2-like [Myxocyprinus asiaticus]|uniref:spermatogenesis-associated serine-rich protein 2-like n=1 Tax=Myxocyprinus asiaticus TaxID=70543 RepID=UPI0022232322|nr:spermatogenesis-associated serine-rich protein 2-like [Myxocyprinus asiaticus]XP_051509068.1 spermatogenesis-associated serine-rich protein 2-like [Myxocyprinus asiaticus]XP_051509069.1 spermatogenesis-associated serine-rich protein 2-like [Myxocyprinus asiaticus]XP_051509070.1 spermatogenesis-associated serine-rich protein 2-like [Myxocyprinus asiaticus]XP_051509071.1 spermatogenesis-associated serine-rich protein 2-like [Myxocyprinus asiaticus]XP_051509073.1 spermatogenesis-associated ser
MARKSSYKDVSGVVFDTHSKMVMSQGGSFERMKEKINAVRAVVPNKSNNEIALVLQHFENCVDRAVQAFVEGSAVEILKEWNVTGKKKPKKKKKPKPQTDAPVDATPTESNTNIECPDAVNGFHANGTAGADGDSLDSLSEQLDSASLDAAEFDSESAAPDLLDAAGGDVASTPSPAPQLGTSDGARQNHHGSRGNKFRPKPVSSSQNSSVLSLSDDPQQGSAAKKIGSNVDRSVKDLQRCAASLSRYRVVVRDEMDSSIKNIKQTFSELQSCLMDREVTLLTEMDKVKAEAMAILDGRQKRAEELKRLTDKSATLSEEQLTELRADIKHFVSERKYDEDLGKAVKFSYDLEPLKCSIMSFGSVYHPQTSYSSRSRCSSTSSSVTGSAPAQAPPPSELQHQASVYTSRPNVPHKQIFQGNRRIIHGYQGNQRYNGNAHYDRNPGRTNYRYQGDRNHGDQSHQSDHSDGLNSQLTNSARGPSYSSADRPDRSAHNGLPQRQPRTHCP